jgi:hypothetical protein
VPETTDRKRPHLIGVPDDDEHLVVGDRRVGCNG